MVIELRSVLNSCAKHAAKFVRRLGQEENSTKYIRCLPGSCSIY